jgi:hypothetical protein
MRPVGRRGNRRRVQKEAVVQDHGEQSSQALDGSDEPDVEAHRLDAIELDDGEDDESAPEPPRD